MSILCNVRANNAVKANVKMVAENLKCSGPILSELVDSCKLKVVAAYYDLDLGLIEIISE